MTRPPRLKWLVLGMVLLTSLHHIHCSESDPNSVADGYRKGAGNAAQCIGFGADGRFPRHRLHPNELACLGCFKNWCGAAGLQGIYTCDAIIGFECDCQFSFIICVGGQFRSSKQDIDDSDLSGLSGQTETTRKKTKENLDRLCEQTEDLYTTLELDQRQAVDASSC